MFRLSLLPLLAVALYAQDPADLFHKPPVAVDQALRARVTEFFDLHVKGEFRRAESLVAEDTKDFFYDTNKPRYLSFQITQIKYNDDFTRAQVTVLCEQYINLPGFEGKPIKLPNPSTWKLENGKWCWYVDQELLRQTPFGRMGSNAPLPSAPGSSAPPPIKIPTAEEFYSNFKADKEAVTLSSGETEEVTFSNTSPAAMTVAIERTLPGIEATFDQREVKAGGHAVLKLRAADGAKSGTLQVRIDPVGKIIPIQVSVK